MVGKNGQWGAMVGRCILKGFRWVFGDKYLSFVFSDGFTKHSRLILLVYVLR